jgi:hypothetical protein
MTAADDHATFTTLAEVTFPVTPSVEHQIQWQVCAYVDELKAVGLSPERVPGAIMLAASTAGLHPSLGIRDNATLEAKDKLLADMIGWCVEHYYRSERGVSES